MRDQRFKAEHRGGPLDVHRHRLLAIWAAACVEHVLPVWNEAYQGDDRPRRAIEIVRAWARGEATVGEAREAAFAAHAAARNGSNGAVHAVARAAGHAVATAHMADHALQAAAYAVKAVQVVNTAHDRMAAERERSWQQERLPEDIRSLVIPNP